MKPEPRGQRSDRSSAVSLALASALLVTAVSACSPQTASSSAPEATKNAPEPEASECPPIEPEARAEDPPAAQRPPQPGHPHGLPPQARTPRARAAWGMLQYLDLMAVVGERLSPGMFDGDCGGPARALTFSMAKTDPWGSDFFVQCPPHGKRITSPGADKALGTADDIRGYEPFVSGPEACEAACARAEDCASDFFASCAERCAAIHDPRIHFALDSCAALSSCEDVRRCFEFAEVHVDGTRCAPQGSFDCSPALIDGGCDAFVRIAADLAHAGPESHPKLRAACEDYGTAYVHDLVCLEGSSSLEEAARCHLTVYRGWIEPFVRR